MHVEYKAIWNGKAYNVERQYSYRQVFKHSTLHLVALQSPFLLKIKATRRVQERS